MGAKNKDIHHSSYIDGHSVHCEIIPINCLSAPTSRSRRADHAHRERGRRPSARPEQRGQHGHSAGQPALPRTAAGGRLQGHAGPCLRHVPQCVAGRAADDHSAHESAGADRAARQVVAEHRRRAHLLQAQGDRRTGGWFARGQFVGNFYVMTLTRFVCLICVFFLF